jgi:hypothetical protein
MNINMNRWKKAKDFEWGGKSWPIRYKANPSLKIIFAVETLYPKEYFLDNKPKWLKVLNAGYIHKLKKREWPELTEGE